MLFSSVRTLSTIFLILLTLLPARHSYASLPPPISIVCPCNVERVNQTKAVAKFSVAFDKEVTESGEFSVNINSGDTLGKYPEHVISQRVVPSINYYTGARELEVSFPFYRYTTNTNQFLSLFLYSKSGSVIDAVFLNESPIKYGDDFGVAPSAENKLIFDTPHSFTYDASTFSFSVAKVSNLNLKNISDEVQVKLVVANPEGSYYTKSQVETTIEYDANGVGSLNVSGPLTQTMDSHLTSDTDYTHILILISRDDNLLLQYQAGVLPGGSMLPFEMNLNNIDTLIDSDNDGITDFNERLIGTPVNESSPVGSTTIEVAFTYGEAAKANQGGGLDARIAHLLAVTNTAFSDSGLDINFKEVLRHEVGDDTSLNSQQVLDALEGREGIFSQLDSVLTRKPDLFLHLSSLDSFEENVAGRATLLGSNFDGIIGYQDIYSSRTNAGTVAIENTTLTLPHEIGHLMGLVHARRQYDSSPYGTFRWSVGYGQDDRFRTIMAVNFEFGSANRVGFFSSPGLKCGTSQLPCGIERGDYLRGADSVKSLQTTALQIAAISNGFSPTITLVGDKTVNLTIGQSYSEQGFSAYDKEDGNLTNSVVVSGSVDTRNRGSNAITYTVADNDENVVTLVRTILVDFDMDGDLIGDDIDEDRDGDGYINNLDIFPDDLFEWFDSDGDGLGDNVDEEYNPYQEKTIYLVNRSDACSDGGHNLEIEIDGKRYAPIPPGEALEISIALGKHVRVDYYNGLRIEVGITTITTRSFYRGRGCNWDDFSYAVIGEDYQIRFDSDEDGTFDYLDAFPNDPAESSDTDNDGIGDNADNCVTSSNPNQLDIDGDQLGDACDTDDDNDGYSDADELDGGTNPLDADDVPMSGLNWGFLGAIVSKDITPPVITVVGDNPLTIQQGNDYLEPGVSATDDKDGVVPVVTTGVVDIDTVGSYTLIYTATDTSGNTATATREVVVE